ncbi:MAG: hypothetical protein NC217_08335 [Muribaculaceae bacterium]|nr:hypothetical protein [Muribaculaceae bacterium]
MKKSIFVIYSLIVMLVMSMTVMSCSNSKRHHDRDDEETEQESRKDKDKDDDEDDDIKDLGHGKKASESDSDAVSAFCDFVDETSNSLVAASTEAEADEIIDRYDFISSNYLDDTTPLSGADKKALSYSLGQMYGVMIGKAIALNGGDINLDELTPIVETMGAQIDKAVNASSSLSELQGNLDRYVNNSL